MRNRTCYSLQCRHLKPPRACNIELRCWRPVSPRLHIKAPKTCLLHRGSLTGPQTRHPRVDSTEPPEKTSCSEAATFRMFSNAFQLLVKHTPAALKAERETVLPTSCLRVYEEHFTVSVGFGFANMIPELLVLWSFMIRAEARGLIQSHHGHCEVPASFLSTAKAPQASPRPCPQTPHLQCSIGVRAWFLALRVLCSALISPLSRARTYSSRPKAFRKSGRHILKKLSNQQISQSRKARGPGHEVHASTSTQTQDLLVHCPEPNLTGLAS